MDFMYMLEILPEFLSLLHITVFIIVVSAILGLFFSIFVTIVRVKKIFILSRLTEMYISFARSVPIVLQLFLVYYAIPFLLSLIGINISDISAISATVVALTFYNAGYMSEVLRPAYLAVDRGQHEAADSLGYTPFKKLIRIIIPQVIPIALPGWGNAIVYLVHDTSLVFTIGVMDMMGHANTLISSTYGSNQIEIYLTIALIFWAICLTTDFIVRFFEKRTKRYKLDTFGS